VVPPAFVEADNQSVAYPFVVEHTDSGLLVQLEPHIVLVGDLWELIRIPWPDSAGIEVAVEIVAVAVAVEAGQSQWVEDFDKGIDSLVDLALAVVPSSCCTCLRQKLERLD
jgi:hypothetical protein